MYNCVPNGQSNYPSLFVDKILVPYLKKFAWILELENNSIEMLWFRTLGSPRSNQITEEKLFFSFGFSSLMVLSFVNFISSIKS